jgi:AcrR family transcriptional regulator
MPRLTPERWSARRRQILDGAWKCFSDKGFQATTMDDVVTASGVPAASLYTYFATKSELVAATAQVAIDDFADLLERLSIATPPPPPGDVLRSIRAELQRRHRDERKKLTRIAVATWAEALTAPEVRAAIDLGYTHLREALLTLSTRWIEQGSCGPESDPRAITELVITLATGMTVAIALDQDISHLDAVLDRAIH